MKYYNKRILIFTLRILFGIIILWIVFDKIGIINIIETLKKINYIFIFPILLFFFSSWMVGILNIFLLLKPYPVNISIWKLFQYYWISQNLSLILPGRLGDISLAWFLKKDGLDYNDGLVILLLDKAITLFTAAGISVLGTFLFLGAKTGFKIISYFTLFFLLLTLSIILILKFFKIFSLTMFLNKTKQFLRNFFLYFHIHKKILVINVLLTVLRFLIASLCSLYAFSSLGQSINLLYIFLVVSAGTLTALIPITINGLGFRQALGVYIFSYLLNINDTLVGAHYVILLIISYTSGLLTATFYKHKS